MTPLPCNNSGPNTRDNCSKQETSESADIWPLLGLAVLVYTKLRYKNVQKLGGTFIKNRFFPVMCDRGRFRKIMSDQQNKTTLKELLH